MSTFQKPAPWFGAVIGRNLLGLDVIFQPLLPRLSVRFQIVYTRQRSLGEGRLRVIHQHDPCPEGTCYPVGASNIDQPHSRPEIKPECVGQRDTFFFGLEGAKTHDRAEYFLVPHPPFSGASAKLVGWTLQPCSRPSGTPPPDKTVAPSVLPRSKAEKTFSCCDWLTSGTRRTPSASPWPILIFSDSSFNRARIGS